MVNELQQIKDRVVKVEIAPENERVITSRAGHAVVQNAARKARFISQARRLLPARKDPSQGFTTASVALALVHGLLSGGRGFSATEPMRNETPLLRLLGLGRAPSAETVEEVVKYIANEGGGREALAPFVEAQLLEYIKPMSRRRLCGPGGFVFVFIDGSVLEVTGKRFDSVKTIKGATGQLCVSAYVGKWLAACEFAREGEGEETVGRRLLAQTVERVLRPARLVKRVLVVLDSLYGDGPTLDEVEKVCGAHYIIGANNLTRAQAQMQEAPQALWREALDRPETQVMQMWLECEGWATKRLLVCRRWRNRGEMLWNYSGVLTDLGADHPRVMQLMAEKDLGFEEIIWQLYSHKQAMENLWKEMLIDLGLHHPPSARAVVNAVFYNLAAVAYNLSVFAREVAFRGQERSMRLWRFRQEVLHLAGRVIQHGRYVTAVLLDARDHLVSRLADAMARLDGL
jgi:hypothetical protein